LGAFGYIAPDVERTALDEILGAWLASLEGGPDSPQGQPPDSRRYRLGPAIGRGGVGVVRLAFDPEIGRPVALKTLIAGPIADTREVGRFLAEARVTGQLDHPTIVPVHELGRLPDGPPYYTMKLVQGRTLHDVLQGLRDRNEAVEQEFGRVRLLHAFVQVCAGIGYAHAKGVVHRDLNPNNIMLGAHGEVLVMDWGLSKVRGDEIRRSGDDAPRTVEGQVMGTPTYMAPEQALGRVDEIDARTDVYSLGAILYEILTHQPPFSGETPLAVLAKVTGWSLVPPRLRAPDLEIPEELEQICLRALAKERAHRYASASELRRDLEKFLEGARARQQADEHAARGAAQVGRHQSARQEATGRWAEARGAGRALRPFDPPEAKRPVWALERAARQAEAEAAQAFAQAASEFEKALAFVPSHREARHKLADLYYQRFEEAEARHDLEAAVYFRTQVEAYEDGRYAERLRGDGTLAFATDPPDAEVAASRYNDDMGVLRAEPPMRLGPTPLSGVRLPMGSYLMRVHAEGRLEARFPVRLGRGESTSLRVRLLAPDELEDDLVYVPAGQFLFGGDLLAPSALEGSVVDVQSFAIARFPVTQREYLEFIHELSRRDADEARRRVPRTETEHRQHWVLESGAWRIPEVDGDGDPWDERMPVIGVGADDAEAYCRWLSARIGRSYRLPTEEEWEKAARGVDGRIFPWGDRFDATFCKMRESRPGRTRLEVIGAFPQDESPYGVRDLAGGVREWVQSRHVDDPSLRVVRGGGAGATALTCRLCYRSWHQPTDVTSYFGFRIARSV